MKFNAAALFAAIALLQPVFAVDGISVSFACRFAENAALVPERPLCTESDGNYQPGKIIRINISNSAVTSCDTIYKQTFARFPVLNLDGTRIAFQRWGASLQNGTLVGQNLPMHISVMDMNGQNVKDLVVNNDQEALIDWARINGEDWVFYTKPGPEVWKVKCSDTTTNALAYSYVAPKVDGFWRWDISANATRAMINYHFTNGGYTNVPHALPFSTVPLPRSQGGTADDQISCNGCISPSGKYIATFMTYGHSASTLSRWDPGKFWWGSNYQVVNHLTDVTAIIGEYAGNAMEMQRWSANSDKWMCLCPTSQYVARWDASNQLLSNWVDKEYILTTHNPLLSGTQQPIVYYTLQGDFWVKPPAGKEGCYEDSLGNWISIGQVGAIDDRSRSIVNPGSSVQVVNRSTTGITLTMPDKGEHLIEVFGMNGRCLRTMHSAASHVVIDFEGSARTIAVVKITSGRSDRTETIGLIP